MKNRSWIGRLGIALWSALWLSAVTPGTALGAGDGFTLDDLHLDSAGDLVDACTIDQGNEHYEAAMAFCYGFFEGAMHYDDVISTAPGHVDLVCSPQGTTRSQAVEVFVAYMLANRQYGEELPIDAIFRALMDKWPCPA